MQYSLSLVWKQLVELLANICVGANAPRSTDIDNTIRNQFIDGIQVASADTFCFEKLLVQAAILIQHCGIKIIHLLAECKHKIVRANTVHLLLIMRHEFEPEYFSVL